MNKDALRFLKLEPTYAVWLSIENRKIIGELEVRMLRSIKQEAYRSPRVPSTYPILSSGTPSLELSRPQTGSS
jgi:hypothetical protein